jgi:hypothetical protein
MSDLFEQEGMGSNVDRKTSILSLFSINRGKNTVYPHNGDIEAGGSRRVKFTKIHEGSENSAIKMVRHYSSPVRTNFGFYDRQALNG